MVYKTNYRRDIQVLRGISVLAVLLFHAKESYFPLGYLGVDVFFVISGLVITPLLFEIFRSIDFWIGLKSFYTRRFFRLAPALGSTLGFSAPLVYFLGNLNDLKRFASQGISSLLIIGNFGAWKFSGNYFSPNSNPLIHTWSLSVEEQIYIFLPFAMLLIGWKNRSSIHTNWNRLFIFLFSFSFLLFFAPRFLSYLGVKFAGSGNLDFFFYFSLSRLWEFLAGSLIYLFRRTIFSRTIKWAKILKVTTLLSVFIILFNAVNLSNAKITPILVLLTVIHLLCDETLNKSKFSGLLSWDGDRSYSIYLVHMPLIYLAKYSPGLGSGLYQDLLVFMMICTSILLGHLQFELIEKKFRLRDRKNSLMSAKLIPRAVISFIGIPMLLFGLILGSAQIDFKPIVNNFVKDSKVGSRLLARAGCVDKEFTPSKCSWNVSPSKGSVLLVGDSQAYAAAEGVQLAANRLHLNFLGISASG